jgi:hypothetical protein
VYSPIPILAPVFAWNHNEVMREGGRGLAHHLGATPLDAVAPAGADQLGVVATGLADMAGAGIGEAPAGEPCADATPGRFPTLTFDSLEAPTSMTMLPTSTPELGRVKV